MLTHSIGVIWNCKSTERGTSVGSFRGEPVTGKSFEVVAMEWFMIKDGKKLIDVGARATMRRKCVRWACVELELIK
jgi:hypothetical protein